MNEDITETQAKIRNTESEMERLQDAHRNDIRIYIQKVKHLDHDHADLLTNIGAEGEKLRKVAVGEHEKKQLQLKEQKIALKTDLARLEDANQEEIHSLNELMAKELATMKNNFEESLQELKKKYQVRVEELKENLELRRKVFNLN